MFERVLPPPAVCAAKWSDASGRPRRDDASGRSRSSGWRRARGDHRAEPDSALFTLLLDPEGRVERLRVFLAGAPRSLRPAPGRDDDDPRSGRSASTPTSPERGAALPRRPPPARAGDDRVPLRIVEDSIVCIGSRLVPRREDDGRVHVDGIETDVTDRVALEEQLRTTRRSWRRWDSSREGSRTTSTNLTAVYRLRRPPLRGWAERPGPPRGPGDPPGGDRAASLTRQLLAFSRRSPAQPRLVDLNACCGTILPMLQRLDRRGRAFDLALSSVDRARARRVRPSSNRVT